MDAHVNPAMCSLKMGYPKIPSFFQQAPSKGRFGRMAAATCPMAAAQQEVIGWWLAAEKMKHIEEQQSFFVWLHRYDLY